MQQSRTMETLAKDQRTHGAIIYPCEQVFNLWKVVYLYVQKLDRRSKLEVTKENE